MATTLKDIAEATDMSIAAVSLVLGNKPNRISKEKQALIWKTAQKMHYISAHAPHPSRMPNRRLIGAIFHDGRNLHYSAMLMSLNNICLTRGWHMVTAFSGDTITGDVDCLNTMMAMNVDAIVFCPSSCADTDAMNNYLDILQYFQGPVIFVERYHEFSSNYSAFAANRKKGSYLALKHLLELGHKSIGILCGPNVSQERWITGMGAAFEEMGMDISSLKFYFGDDTPLSGYEIGAQIVQEGNTAVFAYDDDMAIGLCRRMHEMGVKIPEDLSIVGFNDIYYSRCLEIPLTSLSVQGDSMGYMIAERLFDELEDKKKQKCVTLIDPVLKVRASTAAPRQESAL